VRNRFYKAKNLSDGNIKSRKTSYNPARVTGTTGLRSSGLQLILKSEMSSKYSNLIDIDLSAPDVYETSDIPEPQLDVSIFLVRYAIVTFIQQGDSDSDNERELNIQNSLGGGIGLRDKNVEDGSIVKAKLQVGKAKKRFENAKGVENGGG
jgi:hypothetical protein